MKTSEQAVWDQFDKVFEQVDLVHEEADKFWAKARKEYGSGSHSRVYRDSTMSKGEHTLRFRAKTLSERWRLSWRFVRMGLRVLRHGHTEFSFRSRD